MQLRSQLSALGFTGDLASQVRSFQSRYNARNPGQPIRVDGIFGPETLGAFRNVQSGRVSLRETAQQHVDSSKPAGVFGGMAGAGLKAPKSLEETQGFQALSPSLKGQTQSLAQGANAMDRATLSGLVNSSSFRGMDADSQQKAINVFRAADSKGRFDLNVLAARNVGGKPALLDRDSTGHTTLDNLDKLASGPLSDEFAKEGVSRKQLLGSTIQEVGQPGQINQDSKGTCTVTSVSYALSQRNPAEYARLVQGLASPEGQVKLRNGDTLDRNGTGIAPDTATDRSASERLLQSSLMDYGNGRLYSYDNVSDTHQSNLAQRVARGWGNMLGVEASPVAKGRSGLGETGIKKVYDGLFGGDAKLVVNDAAGTKALDALAGAKPSTAMLTLKWGNSAHEVAFDRIEGDRVYFRNPWGGRFVPSGAEMKGPPNRRLDDAFTGMESMSLEEAKKHLLSVVRE